MGTLLRHAPAPTATGVYHLETLNLETILMNSHKVSFAEPHRLWQAVLTGGIRTLLADSGYFSEANVEACAGAGVAPLIAHRRERHHLSWQDRFAQAPPAPENATPLEAMRHRLATPEGQQTYALRKQTPEPVFGIIKSVMGFRQFSLRGLDKVKGEWNLVTLAWNVKRMFALQPA